MRAVVTPLRSPTGATAVAAAATVDYVSGSSQAPLSIPVGSGDVVGYFADQTPEGPGRWLGAGGDRFGLHGSVDRPNLEALLRGDDPRSGIALLTGRGSNLRARAAGAASAPIVWNADHYTLQDAAAFVGVSDSYLRRVAGRTRSLLARTGGDAATLAAIEGDGRAFLVADQGDDGRWRITRDELLRFMTARRGASVTMGFDVTFSVPKSVSVLWALADPIVQAEITAAFDQAVETGVAYLERHAAVTGRGADRIHGRGLTAAAFTHATSRRLDPQLHAHVIVANVLETPDGSHRALDGSALYAHARTAGYLAGAQLSHELTERLGVAWRPVRSGIMEIAGVPRAAVETMSQRRQEIDALAQEQGVTTPVGRRTIALRSRSEKQVESLETLRADWVGRLAAVGFDASAHAACFDPANTVRPTTPDDAATLFARLLRTDGLTGNSATFTRQEVLQAVADWSVERLDAPAVERLADELLTDPRVLPLADRPLAPTRLAGVHGHQQRRARVGETRFTTRAMVRAEAHVLTAFRAGLHAGTAQVDPAIAARAIANARDLGADQRAAATKLCRSGHRIQCLVGPAGSGKTHTLHTVAEAWRAAGYRVVGAAVQGTAAENLETETAIPTRTIAAVLAQADRDGPDTVADSRTVLIVDEASVIGTFDLARLVHVIEAADAALVLVGDPAQHSAVTAGGGFAAITRKWSNQVARLSESRRQSGRAMANVRQAVDELRVRDTDVALHRLVVDGRVQEAPTREEAYTTLISEWISDRTAASGAGRRVCIVTDDHRTRRALIDLARAHLQASGDLTGTPLCVAGQNFQAGDEVIARAPARDLHPPGAPERYVRNGTCGQVVAVHDAASMTVDFEGRGLVAVPAEALEREVRPGISGVLTHSYALTSHAAQGATFDKVHAFATETTSPAALYVAASRGREDLRIHTAPAFAGEEFDAVERDRYSDSATGLQALVRSVRDRGDDCLAVERDPTLLVRVDNDTETPAPSGRFPEPDPGGIDAGLPPDLGPGLEIEVGGG